MYSCRFSGRESPGNVPRGLASEVTPLPLATTSVRPSGVARTLVGNQPTGMKPSERAWPRDETSNTATSLLFAFATNSSLPSPESARLLGIAPGGVNLDPVGQVLFALRAPYQIVPTSGVGQGLGQRPVHVGAAHGQVSSKQFEAKAREHDGNSGYRIIAVGADGIIVDVHPQPETARCDGAQALVDGDLRDLAHAVRSASHGRKLVVSERAIVTPSARDLAEAHQVFTRYY